jgi:Asp-tRNA(Asn)/Glu-tRNA(Gln) amidotransferase A subunit family amidase
VEEIELPSAFSRAHAVHACIYDRSLSYYFKDEFKEHSLISPIMYEIINRGNEISLPEYLGALREQDRIGEAFEQLMMGYDAILTLSTGGAALEGLDRVDRPDSCLVWTLCGAPSVNVPAFTNEQGLPFGAQLVARKYNDLLLMNLLRDLRDQELAPEGTNPRPPATVMGE